MGRRRTAEHGAHYLVRCAACVFPFVCQPTAEDLGEHFGHHLYEAELRYLVAEEWVVELDDAIWRRTKLGMWLDDAQKQRVAQWLAEHKS